MDFSVAAIGSFDAMPGCALELLGSTVLIEGSICSAVSRLLAPHFIRHVGTVWIAITAPFGRQTGAIAAAMLRWRARPRQQNGTVSLVSPSVAIRIAITHPNLRDAIAVVGASKRTSRAISTDFYVAVLQNSEK